MDTFFDRNQWLWLLQAVMPSDCDAQNGFKDIELKSHFVDIYLGIYV